eukprot:Em0350g1a
MKTSGLLQTKLIDLFQFSFPLLVQTEKAKEEHVNIMWYDYLLDVEAGKVLALPSNVTVTLQHILQFCNWIRNHTIFGV